MAAVSAYIVSFSIISRIKKNHFVFHVLDKNSDWCLGIHEADYILLFSRNWASPTKSAVTQSMHACMLGLTLYDCVEL